MAWHRCPKCGEWRKIDIVIASDGWHQPPCYSCGDPGYLEPLEEAKNDMLNERNWGPGNPAWEDLQEEQKSGRALLREIFMDPVCMKTDENPNTAAGFPRAWDGNWRGPEPWNNPSSLRTRHPRRLAGSKMMRPKHGTKKAKRS